MDGSENSEQHVDPLARDGATYVKQFDGLVLRSEQAHGFVFSYPVRGRRESRSYAIWNDNGALRPCQSVA